MPELHIYANAYITPVHSEHLGVTWAAAAPNELLDCVEDAAAERRQGCLFPLVQPG